MIQEATIKQEPLANVLKVFPAFMTFDEYLKIANPLNKFHPSEAYNWTVAKMNEYKRELGNKYFTKKLNGRSFTFYVLTEDKTDSKYVKKDSSDDFVRDESGELQYYTKDELKLMFGGELYRYTVTVVDDETKDVVGSAQDEWSALLIAVASEYRGFGIGTIIGTIIRKLVPDYDSGGLTNAGRNNLHRVYTNFVKDAMAQGLYTQQIRKGNLTVDQVKKIIASANLTKEVPKKQTNYDNTNSDDWLLMQYESAFILYNKNLIDMWSKDDVDEFWKDKFILGMVYCGGGPINNEEQTIMFQFGGETETIKKLMMALALGDAQINGEDVRIPKGLAKYITFDFSGEQRHSYKEPVKYLYPVQRTEELVKPLAFGNVLRDYQKMFATEKKYRKIRDKYDEFSNWLLEEATAKYDDIQEK